MINALQERADGADVAVEVGPPKFMRVFIERDDLGGPETLEVHRGYLRCDQRAGLAALEDHHGAIDRTETVPEHHLGRLALECRCDLGTRALRHAGDRSLGPLRREGA